jgi:putative tryptophan/tyrosine transport system substrate-binding protein
MIRREFITLLDGAVVTWPLAARAQQGAMPVIGFLNIGEPNEREWAVAAFLRGLKEIGFVEGQNVVIEYRWARGQYDKLPALAADLVRSRVVVVTTGGGPAPALAAMAATKTIPIIFNHGGDPVEQGLVASLNHPGGNATGFLNLNAELEPKRLELLRGQHQG